MPATEIDPERRASDIKTRQIEIHAALTESKRAYICEGAGMPFEERVTLEAEAAQLSLEARRISGAAEAAKVARRQRINAELLTKLIEVLTERGLDELVAEAQRRSDAALAALTDQAAIK